MLNTPSETENGERQFSDSANGRLIGLRLPASTLSVLDKWIAKQQVPGLTRQKAIRMLIERIAEPMY